MSLSFREEAAIRILTTAQCSKEEAASAAQGLATASCNNWGHDYDLDPTIYKATCKRCGFKTGKR